MLSLAISGVKAHAVETCLHPQEIANIVEHLEVYATRIDVTRSESEGSGFLLNSALGVELVTAHHVIVDDNSPESVCLEPEEHPQNPLQLNPASILFHSSQPERSIEIQFSTAPQNLNFAVDLVKIQLPGRQSYNALEAEASARPPLFGEQVIIAGFPAAKNRNFMQHSCVMTGYTKASQYEASLHYAVNCPNLDYDIAAMSGGLAISGCTGKVIGAVNGQNFDERCPHQGDSRNVEIAPLSLNSDREIVFGIQLFPKNLIKKVVAER